MGRDDAPDFAQLQARPAPRTPVERANDQSLEWAILMCRVAAVLAAVALVVALVALVWTGDARWALTALLVAVAGGGCGWWGWWVKGNEEWRHAPTQR